MKVFSQVSKLIKKHAHCMEMNIFSTIDSHIFKQRCISKLLVAVLPPHEASGMFECFHPIKIFYLWKARLSGENGSSLASMFPIC